MDVTTEQLRLLLRVEEYGSLTDAAAAAGSSASTLSRQVAAAERAFGVTVFRRSREGMEVTAAGREVLVAAARALRELDAAVGAAPARSTVRPVRVGAFPFAALTLLPEPLARLRRQGVTVETHEAPSPRLIRMLRSGSLDLAVITTRPPHRAVDDGRPALRDETLLDTTLAVAVAARGRFGGRSSVSSDELADEPWIGSPGSLSEPRLGVWPGFPGRPRMRFASADWGVTLAFVAAGVGVTTVPLIAVRALPPEVTVVRMADLPVEERRLHLVHGTAEPTPEVREVAAAIRWGARQLDAG